MSTFSNNLVAKSGNETAMKYYCEKCDYVCNKKYNWNKHITTAKHLELNNVNDLASNINTLVAKSGKELTNFCCEKCNKKYNDRSGLWRHKQKCKSITTDDVVERVIENKKLSEIDKDDLIIQLLKQTTKLMEIIEGGTHNTITNNTTNSHNKAFNLNFFLNETCKNAMNITEFVDSIQYQLSEFEKMSEIGYVEGISNIIVKNLNALDVTQRPLHCTDKKRETIYIKDQDKWEKGDEENTKIRKVIKKVANKNAMLIHKFTEKHPDFKQHNSKYSTQYHKLIIESFGGSGDNDLEKEDKIIRNISKNIVVDK